MSKQKIWLLTGAAHGLGRAWTETALARGDRVIATARDVAELDPLTDQYGNAVLALPLDVRDRKAVFDAVRKGHERFGRIDVVVNNAGYGYMGAVEELEPDEVRANFETNFFGMLSVLQAVVPVMRAQGAGHIINVSSIVGVVAMPTGGSYVATKFAIEGMTEALAAEVGGFGIKVTMIEPGPYNTGFLSGIRFAPTIDDYTPVKDAVHGQFDPSTFGKPEATGKAILAAVDAEQPPLRLVLGSVTLPMFRAAYSQRLKTWDEWEVVSDSAQG